jgi:hypothetical protein
LGALLLSLNDALADDRRQRLMRFVLKLPGSRDLAKVERRRCRFLYEAFCRLFERFGLAHDDLASTRRTGDARRMFAEELGERVGQIVDEELVLDAADTFFDAALDIIDAAFAIGRQAHPATGDVIEARMSKALALQRA